MRVTPTPIDKRNAERVVKRVLEGLKQFDEAILEALPAIMMGMRGAPDEAFPDFFEGWVRADPYILRCLAYNEIDLGLKTKAKTVLDKYFRLVPYERAQALCFETEAAVQKAELLRLQPQQEVM